MADAFSVLARELNTTERRLLLARILSSTSGEEPEEVPLLDRDGMDSPSLKDEYTRLSFIRKLILAFQSFFLHRTVFELTEDLLHAKLHRRIIAANPGLIDFHTGRFTMKMHDELQSLSGTLSFLRSILDGIPKERGFIAFLAGVEMSPLNDRIMSETDPRGIYLEPHLTEERAIRAEMWERFNRLLEEITQASRSAVYADVKRLQALDVLSNFRIEEAIQMFGRKNAEEGSPLLEEMEGRLIQLDDFLTVAFNPPSQVAWKALFLYRASDALSDPDFDAEKEAAVFMGRVSYNHKKILEFLSKVPLTDILRYIMRDISFVPKKVKGGEEWFVLFRGFWEDRLDETMREYSIERKKESCLSEVYEFLRIPELPFLSGYPPSALEDSFDARHRCSLAILRGFHDAVYVPKIERLLKIVNISGDFFREENRAAFSDCCEKVATWQRRIGFFEKRLSAEGELGMRTASLPSERNDPETRDKLRSLVDEANGEARRILDTLYSTLCQLSRILFGFLYGEAGSPYDSLMNLKTIGGRENKAIVGGLESAVSLIDHATTLVAQMRDAELS